MPASATDQRTIARLDSLTGVRAVAAGLVFWHHVDGLEGGSFSSGMVGVSLFYLLSGFVMAWVDRDGDTAILFYRRRFARIYPAYAVAVTVALAYAAVARGVEPPELMAYTMMQSWSPDPVVHFAASTVFWSLSCEAFFYLAYPLIRRATGALTNQGVWALAIGAAAVSLGIALATSGLKESERVTWVVVVFPPVRLPEFVIGACLGTLMARGWRPRVSLPAAVGLSVAAVLAAASVPYSLSRYAITLIPFALLIVALVSADLDKRPAITRATWMVKLGVWSYCFYLVHLVVIMVVVSVNDRIGMPLAAVVALSLAGSVIAAWLLHILVEHPAERRLRPVLARSRKNDD